MAGPLDILTSLAGKHSKSATGASAKAPKLPAVDAKTAASYKKVGDELAKIQEKMRGIADEKGLDSSLEKLAKKARRMRPLQKAIADVVKAEKIYLKLLKDETASIGEQVKAYNNLAAAKKKQVQVGNEMQGAFGRMKNVMGSFSKANILLGVFAVVARDAVLIARQANEGFDVMARSGQALGKSISQLTADTASYSLGLNKAAISGALMGHSGEDSKKAFQLLTQTFGGTSGAIEDVSTNFGDLATIAKFSGLSMGEAAAFADKNWRRLGKTMKESEGDLAQMGFNTQHLNNLFGAGKVDTREYAQTVSDLSFQAGNYNQNTKFLIESLNRELAVQLSLGKSRDAAMDAARKNLEKAGKANILGAQIIGDKLQAEFDAGGISMEDAMERFGSQGELVYKLLEEGIGEGNNLFALAELLKEGSELQGELNKQIKADARRGGALGMAAGVLTLPEQEVLALQERTRGAKFEQIRDFDVDQEDGMKKLREQVQSLFPGVAEIEDDAERVEAQERIEQFGRDIRSDDPTVDAFEKFDEVIDLLAPATEPGKTKDPVDKFLDAVGGGNLFMGALGALNNMPDVIKGLPMTMVAALAWQEANKSKEGIGAWVKSVLTGKDPLDADGTKQVTRRGSRGRVIPKYTTEQMVAAQMKQKRDIHGAQYDFSKKAGRSEAKDITRDEFIDQKMEEEAFEGAGKTLGENRALDTTFGDLTSPGSADVAAVMLATSSEATPATKLSSEEPGMSRVPGTPAGTKELVASELSSEGDDWWILIPGARQQLAQDAYANSADVT